MVKKPEKTTEYTAKDIYVLEGLEPVRKRPAMYIGSTGLDGLHHLIWEVVDNSLTYQTPVLIKEQDKIRIEKIGEAIDRLFKKNAHLVEKSINSEAEILREGFAMQALSFDSQNLKLKFQPIFSLIRHKVNSEIYRITLQNGRQIEITPYHSLFTLEGGEVLPIRGSDLKKGTPVVVPRLWPEVERPIEEIDLIDELLKLAPAKTKRINLYGLTTFLKNNLEIALKIKSQLPQYELPHRRSGWVSPTEQFLSAAFIPGLGEARYSRRRNKKSRHRANIWQDYLRYNYLPFNLIRNLNPEELDKVKAANPYLGNKRSDNWRIKPKVKVTKELVELLGLFAAEGSIVKNKKIANRLVLSFGVEEKDLTSYACSLIEKTFDLVVKPYYAHETARTIAIDSHLLALIFKEVIKTGENSSDKKVPDLIFNLNQKLREKYLIAYLAGDGYPTKIWTKHLLEDTIPAQDEREKFSAVAKNKHFISTLSYLLSSLNKTYSYGIRKRKNGKRFISITYKELKKNQEIKSRKFSFALDFYWNTNSSYVNYFPFDEVIEKCLDQATFNQRDNGQLGISQNKVLALLEGKKLVLKTGALCFLNSDLDILRVRKIDKIKYHHPWVYDISVPNGENFVAGFSPILAHNSLDEAMGGHCNEIDVSLLSDNRVMVRDNGRGIPVDKHPQTKKSALETVMTTLHAGAKFGGKAYQVSGGLHGVGVSVVCALSKWMKSEVCRDGFKYSQEYVKGKPKTAVKKIGPCRQRGTTITFEPDGDIFREIKFDFKKILDHLRQQAYLTKGVRINVSEERGEEKKTYSFYFEGGLQAYVKYLIRGINTRHPNIFYCLGEKDGIIVEAAFQYTDEYETYEEGFANNIWTQEGGTHLTGFRTALTRTFNDYARKNGFLKESDENLNGEDVREGFTGVVSVKIKEPQFEGQTKAKLGNPEAKVAVETVVSEALADFLERNPQDARAIIERCIISAKARKAAKAARETVLRKGILEGLALPGKLADCSSRNPEESELYIVEGESAGGSSRQARDRHFQAILPLRGKILNVERARLDKILESKEIKSLIIAMGTAIKEDFDITKARYHRIIIMCDADSDGNHIRTLLLTLFYRYFRPIIEQGYLYIAQPPLYKIQFGKNVEYAYTETDKAEILEEIKAARKKEQKSEDEKTISGVSIQRYKGLGEMNPEQLWETTMNPENRVLLKVSLENAKEADRIFDILMGDEVLPRKKFIQMYAKKVKNLDI